MATWGATPAHALSGPVTDHIEDVKKHLVRGGSNTPTGLGTCVETCDDLWLSEHRPMPGQPSSGALWRDLFKARRAAQLARFARGATIIGLGSIALEIGLKEGAKWLGLTTPEGSTYSAVYSQRMVWYNGGGQTGTGTDDTNGGAAGMYVVPAGGLFVYEWRPCNGCSYRAYFDEGAGYAPPNMAVVWQSQIAPDRHIYAEPAETLEGRTPVDDYIAQPFTVEQDPETTPSAANVNTDVTTFLNSPAGANLELWYCQQLGGTTEQCGSNVDPYTDAPPDLGTATVPDCVGLTQAACEALLVGFTNVTVTSLLWSTADVEIDPSHVVETQPAEGAEIDWDDELTVLLNPVPDFMPVFVPDFEHGGGDPPEDTDSNDDGEDDCERYWRLWHKDLDGLTLGQAEWDYLNDYGDVCEPAWGETFRRYLKRLAALGLLGTIVLLDADDLDSDDLEPFPEGLRPGQVIRVRPGVGSRRRKHLAMIADPPRDTDDPLQPATGDEVDDGPGVVTVEILNPTSDPITSEDVAPGDGTDDWTAPNVRGLDLSPLAALSAVTSTFPVGVFGWITAVFGGWSGTGACPYFELPIHGEALPFDFCTFEPAMQIVRPVIVISSAILVIFFFATVALGIGQATEPE